MSTNHNDTRATDQERSEALGRYLRIVIRIGDRVFADPALRSRFDALTADLRARTVEGERSNIDNQITDTES